MKKNAYSEPMKLCPECGSTNVATESHAMTMVNTGEHYCHSMKGHDADSPATCLDCHWVGIRNQLKEST